MTDITKIDPNFVVKTNIQREGLRFYSIEQAPFSIHGIFWENGCYRRLPEAIGTNVNEGVTGLHRHTAGGRVRFVTDSPYIAISAELVDFEPMSHMALSGKAGFDLYTKKQYLGTYIPSTTVTDHVEGVVDLPEPGEREYSINFPLYNPVISLHIGIQEGSTLKAAPAYTIPVPVVYYGSSITQGGCASRPGNAYQSIITRELDCDHINLGFSGSAKAEDIIADYIAGLNMSVFVYDYDHNAPTLEHLKNTHERMFKKIRAAQPELPILMLSRPRYYLKNDDKERLEVIRQTYENALAAGDKNVYFIPGPELLIELLRESALVDNTHPTDCGFASMAYVIGNKLKEILKL